MHIILQPLPTDSSCAHTPSLSPFPPSLQSYDYLGNPRPHPWQGCDFPRPPGAQAVHAALRPVPVHKATLPKVIICIQQRFLFPRAVLNYRTKFPQEVTQRNLFICSRLWVGELHHMNIPASLTSLILSCHSHTHPQTEGLPRGQKNKKVLSQSRNCV